MLQEERVMRRYFIYIIVLIMTLMLGVIYGISINKYNVFPYAQINKSYHYFRHKKGHDRYYGPWSIGIYAIGVRT